MLCYYFTGAGYATHGAELLYDYQHSLPPGERALAVKVSTHCTSPGPAIPTRQRTAVAYMNGLRSSVPAR